MLAQLQTSLHKLFATNYVYMGNRLKEAQLQCLYHLKSKHDILAVMLTGFGKSLIFQSLVFLAEERTEPVFRVVCAVLFLNLDWYFLSPTSYIRNYLLLFSHVLYFITRAEGAELRFGLRSFCWRFYFSCRLLVGARSVDTGKEEGSRRVWCCIVFQFGLRHAWVGRRRKVCNRCFLDFLIWYVFPRYIHYTNISLLLKRRSISRSPHAKLLLKSGVFVSTAGFCLSSKRVKDCRKVSYCQTVINWSKAELKYVNWKLDLNLSNSTNNLIYKFYWD